MGNRQMSMAVRVQATGILQIKRKATYGGVFIWAPDPRNINGTPPPPSRVWWEETDPSPGALPAARARLEAMPAGVAKGIIVKQDGKTLGVQVDPVYYPIYLKELHGEEEANRITFRQNAKAFFVQNVPHQIGKDRLKVHLTEAGWTNFEIRNPKPAGAGKSRMVLAAEDPPTRKIRFAQKAGAPELRDWEKNAELWVVDKEERARKERAVRVPEKPANVKVQPRWAQAWEKPALEKPAWEKSYAAVVKQEQNQQQSPQTEAAAAAGTSGPVKMEVEGGRGSGSSSSSSSSGGGGSPDKGAGRPRKEGDPPSIATIAADPEALTKYLEAREDKVREQQEARDKATRDQMLKDMMDMMKDQLRDFKKDLKQGGA